MKKILSFLLLINFFTGYVFLNATELKTTKDFNTTKTNIKKRKKLTKEQIAKIKQRIKEKLKERYKKYQEKQKNIPIVLKNKIVTIPIKKENIKLTPLEQIKFIKDINKKEKKVVIKNTNKKKRKINFNEKYFIKKNIEIKQLQLKLLELTQKIELLNIKSNILIKLLKRKKDNIIFYNTNMNKKRKKIADLKLKKEINKILKRKKRIKKYYKLTTNFIPLFLSTSFDNPAPIHLLDNNKFQFKKINNKFYILNEPLFISKHLVKNGKVILSKDYKRAYLRDINNNKVALIDKNSKIKVQNYDNLKYMIVNKLYIYSKNIIRVK